MQKTKFHHPKHLPVKLNYGKFALELSEAQYELGILQGSHKNLHNPLLLVAPLTAKEAVVSSKIEGTQSSPKDVFVYEAGGKSEHIDTPEVANYRKAMYFALDEFKKGRKISSHLIKSLQEILLKDSRHDGMLGDYRKKTVYIAEKRSDPIEKALYVPPEHFLIPDYMENLIIFLSSEEVALIKAGMIHYQFEAIHPFEDGNGRIGRLLIPLFLYQENKISLPIIYVSGYLERNRSEYRQALHEVDVNGTYESWLKIFFKAIAIQAKETSETVGKINALYNSTRDTLKKVKSPYIIPTIDFIFEQPIFSVTQLMKKINTPSWVTGSRQIDILKKNKLIEELPTDFSKDKREKLYVFHKLLTLL